MEGILLSSGLPMSFWDSHGDEVSAAITLAVAILIAIVVDRYVIGQAGRVGAASGMEVSRTAQTRLRLVRRLVFVVIVLIGVALALSQFTKIERLATGILASSAVVGLVVGLAARQVIANPMAGIMLAITQPIRVGDTITIDDQTGRVDDLTLSYTFVDTGDGRLMVVPNETVVSSVVFNHSTGDRSAPPMVSVWVPPAADLTAARRALEALEPSEVTVAEITHEGVRLEVHGARGADRTRMDGEEAALRERAQDALRDAGVLQQAG
jgi:small-conductance mechanosensitive channel